MSNNRKGFTHIELTDKFDFFKTLDIHKFYEAINESCNAKEKSALCDTITLSGLEDPDVIGFFRKYFCKSNSSLKYQEFFVNSAKSKNEHCIYFKYWLYDKLIIDGFNQHQINIIFDFIERNKNDFMKVLNTQTPCAFYRLNLKDVYTLKNIYDYAELFYATEMKNYGEIFKNKEYFSYFTKGFDLYKNSKIVCLSDSSSTYCNEFNEHEKIYDKYKKELSLLSCQERFLSSLYNKDTELTEESLQIGKTSSDTLDPSLKALFLNDKTAEKEKLQEFYELLSKRYETCKNDSCNSLKDYFVKEKGFICNLLEFVEKILDVWGTENIKGTELDSNKYCDYLNYWIYDKFRHFYGTPCDIEIFYYIWHDLAYKRHQKGKTCYNKKYYGFSKEELGNKKILFDFLQYYDKIKRKLIDIKDDNWKSYCNYIQFIFQLYKSMAQKNGSQVYTEELRLFQKKFLGNAELHFLERKCPSMCLDLVFNLKYKTLCPLDEKPSVTNEKADLNICEIAELSNINPEVSKNYEKEYIFEDLNTYSVYNKLNREVITDNYYSFCSKLLPFSSKNCGIYGLCVKLARNIKDLSYMKNKERIARCEYIIHWMFDKIRKILKIDTNNNYDTKALNEFFKVGYDIFHKLGVSDCLYNTTNVNFDEQKEIKNLHDYFKDFDKISCDNATNSTKCEKYCEYVQYINSLYGEYIDNCCYCFKSGGCMDRCPDYFKCDDIYNPHNLFEKLKCKNIQKFNEGMKKVDKPPFADHYVTWLTEHFGKEKEKPLLKLEEKELSITPKMESSSTPEKVCDKITCDPFYVSALGVLGLMGFLLISFILYKITPLGSYFHNKDARKKKTHFQQSEEKLLEDDFEFNGTNMKNRRLRLAYHQA
ncbi:PIR Superfamily Protein [Plasmodium ovale curtisi]|uniref:PIR Superfamily Protein n=1 Tax=Plasmodium ovale curtisi TaxID=864141 RepID=A0A1A8WE75_PLAOA|nr:PIR Superfamily Protein [Plasmodium ovale curtisi]